LAVFVIGLAKKVLIADHFGSIGSPLFTHAQAEGSIDFSSAWIAALSYTLQLYFDFSGYSDMAIGLARMFGFRLAVNFLSPYKSASIAEFWRRWHITLSRFLRDYLYVSLGGNRKGRGRTYFNLLATMTLGGLWHGAAWTFVAWGVYHGALLALHRVWTGFAPSAWRQAIRAFRPFSIVVTFLFIVVGWVLFRSPDFQTAATILMSMAGLSDGHPMDRPIEIYAAIVAGLSVCWGLPNIYQVFYRFRPALLFANQRDMARPARPRLLARFSIVEGIILSVTVLACLYVMQTSVSEFLYFMF
jgi:D-alanyl-lipoteichoic acid acyltransferase DltB (MBOAT superfamily)